MIVVGMDSAAASAAALRWAAAEASLRGDRLHVVHVATPLTDLVAYGDAARKQQDDEQRRLETLVDATLGAIGFTGLDITAGLGQPAGTLLDLARGARLVVLGRPARAFHPMRTGVVRTLLDHSPVPTVVVPPGVPEPGRAGIVVGYDGTAPSRAAMRWATREATCRGAEVRALHVAPGTATARTTLVAASRDAELVVVGTRHRSHAGRLLLGSTSRYCAEHAEAPVVVVPLPAEITAPARTAVVEVTS